MVQIVLEKPIFNLICFFDWTETVIKFYAGDDHYFILDLLPIHWFRG